MSDASTLQTAFITALIDILGSNAVLRGEAAMPYHHDERNRYHQPPLAVVLPNSVEQVAAVVKLCATQSPLVHLIAQGGNTGLVGGCAVIPNLPSVILNLSRLNTIVAVDPLNHTLTAQAGATLAQVKHAAAEHGLYFPLSLASEATATIGGNLATNAGGTQVLRYGTMRDLTLGLEVVLADGQIWHNLNTLRKNNTGIDLKHLFIGAEGTLGIITQAVLKCYPRPQEIEIALIHAPDLPQLMQAFAQIRARLDARLTAFEMINANALRLVCAHLNCPHPWHEQQNHSETNTSTGYTALVEISHSDCKNDTLTQTLNLLIAEHQLNNAIIAQNLSQIAHFWRIREHLSAAQKAQGKNIKHDISVPISAMTAFIPHALTALDNAYPHIEPILFGHIGDGNLHFNLSRGTAFVNDEALMACETDINALMYELVQHYHGAISAEHGIGLLKRDWMTHIKSPTELELMLSLKDALDPKGLFNPFKVLPSKP